MAWPKRHDRLQVKHALSLILGFDCVPCVLTRLRPPAALIRGEQAAQDDKSRNEIDERQTFYLRRLTENCAQRLMEQDERGYGEAGRHERVVTTGAPQHRTQLRKTQATAGPCFRTVTSAMSPLRDSLASAITFLHVRHA